MPVETVQQAFENRLATDEFINFSAQKEITKRAGELWERREKVAGKAVFVPVPSCGFFPDNKDVWAVKNEEEIDTKYPYVLTPAVDDLAKLLSVVTYGLELQEKGQKPALVANLIPEQRMEREVVDSEGKLHGVKGTEMALLQGVASFLAQGFPRGLIHTEGHSLGLEYWAGKYDLPVLTLSAMPKLINEAISEGMIDNVRSVAVGGDAGGVMTMNMVSEYAGQLGMEIETVYGEKRAEEVFTDWGKGRIKGAQVLFGDDIISSGKTVFQKVLKTAFEAGARNAVVLVTHADLVQHTLNNLNSCAGRVSLVIGDTFPIRTEVTEALTLDKRILRVKVFEKVIKVAEMDAQNLLADVFTNEDIQAELFRQTEMVIFPSYVARYRTVSNMLKWPNG